MNSLKAMLRRSEPVVGLTTQHVTQKYEHGLFNEAELAHFVLARRGEGLPVVAKSSRVHLIAQGACELMRRFRAIGT